MKKILISKCGSCPYCGRKHGGLYCKKIAEVHQNEVGFDDIHKDCPLTDISSREEAISICEKYTMDDAYAIELIEQLGFKEGGK